MWTLLYYVSQTGVGAGEPKLSRVNCTLQCFLVVHLSALKSKTGRCADLLMHSCREGRDPPEHRVGGPQGMDKRDDTGGSGGRPCTVTTDLCGIM